MNEPLIPLFKEKFFNRKSIGGVAFLGNSATGHFVGIFFFDTPQFILDLMTQVSSLYRVWGLRKRAVRQTNTQILSIIYIDRNEVTYKL